MLAVAAAGRVGAAAVGDELGADVLQRDVVRGVVGDLPDEDRARGVRDDRAAEERADALGPGLEADPPAAGGGLVGRRAHVGSSGSGSAPVQGHVEPDTIAHRDPVGLKVGRVAGRGRERVAFDRAHPEAEALVEAEVPDVRRRGGHDERRAALVAGEGDRGRHQRAADAAALQRLVDGHALDLGRPGVRGVRDQQVADDAVAVVRDEDAAGVEVRVEFLRRVLRELEQRPQPGPRAGVLTDRDRPRHPRWSVRRAVRYARSSSQGSGTSTTRKPSGSSNVRPCSAQYGFAGATGVARSRSATARTAASSPR